jgi:hypothetical protein
MPKDERDLLEVLKSELEFLQEGGYDGLHRKLWSPTFVFEDTQACLNATLHENRLPCTECVLTALVPPERLGERIPCRFIPIKATGETVDSYYRSGRFEELVDDLAEWLRETIRRLEEQRRSSAASATGTK